ncbi:MAG: hypothetical protein JRE14_00210 [Deltaproteobacteria bacterium]|nr:hypothetical protein [Deltaproteobacteria bacterium]MBW2632554.1 hypothetical protein [Deltaproteobacteria bacterium]
MTEYQKEQHEALEMVRKYLSGLTADELADLGAQIAGYLSFRHDVDRFLEKHFNHLCTETCYRSRLSACCTREGIITFFADVVINALRTPEIDIQLLDERLQLPHQGNKCVYLGEQGCLWQVKPLVCEMFLCAKAEKEVLANNPRAQKAWETLKLRGKSFRWPDRSVLFDSLEEIFIAAGYTSSLMYLHNSPGLLRVKKMSSEKCIRQ